LNFAIFFSFYFFDYTHYKNVSSDFLGAIFRYIAPEIFEKVLPEDKEYFRQKVKRQTGSDIEELLATRSTLQTRYHMKVSQMETILTSNQFVFGDTCCYADLMLFAAFQWVVLIVSEDAAFGGAVTYPSTRKWWRRICELLNLK
jgi:glutathione S-transferase